MGDLLGSPRVAPLFLHRVSFLVFRPFQGAVGRRRSVSQSSKAWKRFVSVVPWSFLFSSSRGRELERDSGHLESL